MNTRFDPMLWLLSQMCAAAAQPQTPAFVPQPRPGATTAERHRHYREFGRPLGDGKTKAQREADKRAASIGYGRKAGA
ncbi:MAG TPA: hypothetical protein VM869_19425 [Enhygromyxa sp.]|jgi:hypothetical protein|nr:hypothetical protein [Enhygromyxa sp.]